LVFSARQINFWRDQSCVLKELAAEISGRKGCAPDTLVSFAKRDSGKIRGALDFHLRDIGHQRRKMVMKIRSIITYTSTIAALVGLPLLSQRVEAAPMPFLGQVSIQFGHSQPQPPPETQPAPEAQYQPNWNDDQRRELRHVFYQLEHATGDYEGHRNNAMHEIRHAGEAMGMDLHGPGYARQWEGSPDYGAYDRQPESQEWSDNTLRRCRDRLSNLADSTGEPVRHHLREAAHELDKALDAR
jgi:hypothetical protein